MTTPKDDGGPFHPCLDKSRISSDYPDGYIRKTEVHVPGASFRAVAAMHAMAAMLSDPNATDDVETLSVHAVRYADALIAELKK